MPSLYMQCQCGNDISATRWRAGKRVCTPCGIASGVRHSQEMHEKSGAGYELWRIAMLKLLSDSDSDDGGSQNDDPGQSCQHH